MGCNTSNEVKKELPEGGDGDTNGNNVEDSEKQDNAVENKNGNHNDNNDNDDIEEFDKSTSAKTVTLKSTRPNSENSAASIKAELGSDGPETTVTIEHQNDQNGDFLDVEEALAEELAAAKIQAAFRGHQTRKNMKQADNPVEAEPTKEQLEAEFRADDEELCHAATKIQASFRGHMSRKTEASEGEKPSEPQGDNPVDDDVADIDLTDPDLSKAAVKIQASFRGHMARKEHDK